MRLILILLFLLPSAVVWGQWTPENYRREVVRYSHDLKMSHSRADAARMKADAARKGMLPRLDMVGDFSVSARHYSGRENWNFSLQPQIVQEIYGGGARHTQRDAAAIECRISLLESDFSLLEVRYAADYAYWNLSAMENYASAMRQYVSLISSLKSIIDRRFAEGYVARGDVLMIDARLIEARYELTTAENGAKVALHNFNTLIGASPDAPVRLVLPRGDSLGFPLRITVADMLRRRPDVAVAELRVSLGEMGIRSARAPFNPRLSVGFGAVWKPTSPMPRVPR